LDTKHALQWEATIDLRPSGVMFSHWRVIFGIAALDKTLDESWIMGTIDNRQLYPVLQTFHEAHPDVAVLMVSQGSIQENRQVALCHGLSFPILSWDTQTDDTYQVTGTPFSFGIDSAGFITGAEFATSLEELETLVGKIE
jgi:hypothetical protein